MGHCEYSANGLAQRCSDRCGGAAQMGAAVCEATRDENKPRKRGPTRATIDWHTTDFAQRFRSAFEWDCCGTHWDCRCTAARCAWGRQGALAAPIVCSSVLEGALCSSSASSRASSAALADGFSRKGFALPRSSALAACATCGCLCSAIALAFGFSCADRSTRPTDSGHLPIDLKTKPHRHRQRRTARSGAESLRRILPLQWHATR